MGLLYLYPTQADEKDYIILESQNPLLVRIKSYGLPWIFWLYAAASLMLLAILTFSIYTPLIKLFEMATFWDQVLIYSISSTLILTVFGIFIFLYWQNHIVLTPQRISIEFRPFGIKIFQKEIDRNPQFRIEVYHFLDSPNIARSEGDERYKQFQNKGYFELVAYNNEQKIILDRSSRKQDLEDLKNLITSF
jgi:hypothetical protein